MRIHLEGLTKKYGSLRALEAITAQIDPGQVVALLGPNGAGKTTLLRCMAGVISPSAGRVVYDDLEFNRGMMDLRKRMFFLPDVPFVFEEWSILRHLGMALRLYETPLEGIEEKVIELLNEFELLPLAERPFRLLSRGQRYKAGLAALIAADPELWLVDDGAVADVVWRAGALRARVQPRLVRCVEKAAGLHVLQAEPVAVAGKGIKRPLRAGG